MRNDGGFRMDPWDTDNGIALSLLRCCVAIFTVLYYYYYYECRQVFQLPFQLFVPYMSDRADTLPFYLIQLSTQAGLTQRLFRLQVLFSSVSHKWLQRLYVQLWVLPKRGWPNSGIVLECILYRPWQRTEVAALLMCCFHYATCIDIV